MPGEQRSLQDLIRDRQQSNFFGRQGQVTQFQENLMLPVDDPHRRFLFNIHGAAGVGKTYLTKQLRQITSDRGALTAYTDEAAADPFAVMSAIADAFSRVGVRFGEFEKRATAYRQRRHELESDPQAPEGIATFLTKTAIVVAMAAARDVPIAGSILAPVDSAAVAEQANRARTYLINKFSDHSDVRLLMSPAEELTPVFVAGLNRVDSGRSIALFFDTYERTSLLLDHWLRDLYAGKYGGLPQTLVTTISGQYALNLNLWGDYLPVIVDIPLEPFTVAEARQFLASKSINDEATIDVILKLSGRLPMWLATLADVRPDDAADLGDPAGDAVGRFLKWEDDPARRAIAVKAAIPRFFNRDVLDALAITDKTGELFTWLSGLPFVSQQMGFWKYHDVVRSAMLRLGHAQSPNEWRANHLALANAYAKWAVAVNGKPGGLWVNAEWVGYTCEKIYHSLCADPVQNLPEALATAVNAGSGDLARARQWVTLFTDAARDTDNNVLRQWATYLREGVHDDDLTQYLTFLIDKGRLDEKTLAMALRVRSRNHDKMSRYDEALADLNRAIELDPHNVRALTRRGEIYHQTERYNEALVDFDRAIELDSDNEYALVSRAFTNFRMKHYNEILGDTNRVIELHPDNAIASLFRGVAYIQLDRYDEALADFNRVTELTPDNAVSWLLRGLAFNDRGRHDEALTDLTRAIELDPDNVEALSTRGRIYEQMDRYDEALADLTRAIELDPDNVEALSTRGRIYEQMDRYDEALADLTRAIELNPDNGFAFIHRGQIYEQLGRYDEALADLDRAIELDPDNVTALSRRGGLYEQLERNDEALADLDRAIELDPDNGIALSTRGWTYIILDRNDEALADFNCALELGPINVGDLTGRGWAYQQLGRYDEALADLDRAIELDPEDAMALARRGETYLMSGSYVAGKADLSRAVEIDLSAISDLAGNLTESAIDYLRQGDPGKAAAMFQVVVEVSPMNANARNNYAFCLLPIDPAHALAEFEAAGRLRSNSIVTIANKVLALHLLRRDRDGLTVGYSDAAESAPSQSGTMWNIGDDHVLHLGAWGDVHEYLQALLAHIEEESGI